MLRYFNINLFSNEICFIRDIHEIFTIIQYKQIVVLDVHCYTVKYECMLCETPFMDFTSTANDRLFSIAPML